MSKRRFPGTWNKRDKQWRVMVGGSYHYRTPAQLGCTEDTQEASTTAWCNEVKRLRGEHADSKVEPLRRKLLASLDRRLAIAPTDERDTYVALIEQMKVAPIDNLPHVIPALNVEGLSFGEMRVEIVKDNERQFERERFRQVVDVSDSIGTNLITWLEVMKTRMKLSSYRDYPDFIGKLTSNAILDKEASCETLNESKINDVVSFLHKQNYSTPEAHNKRYWIFTRFVKWCWKTNKLKNMPRNIDDDENLRKMKATEPKKFVFDLAQLESLKLPYRLWAWLNLNTGMQNADLGCLTWEMLEGNILTRRRSKTGEHKNSPTVKYKLWKETMDCLKEFGIKKTGLIFTTETGKPMYQYYMKADATIPTKIDNFLTHWKRNVKIGIPLSGYRKIGSSALKMKPVYRQYVDLYLAHSAATLADKHYSSEYWEAFYEATDFIRDELIVKARNKSKKNK